MVSNSDYILTANDIHREFKTTNAALPVLKGISLKMKRREIAAVTGASGVGKSTLMHILGGLDRPTSGEVWVDDTRLNDRSEQELAQFRNRHIGFVFQFHYLLDDFTALENVMMPLLVAGKKRNEATKKAELLLAQVGLSDRTTHLPRHLSGGEQQRVAVARALANEPQIVLADEPSGNLDTMTGRKLHELLFQLNRDNDISFLIATHNQELAEKCARKFEIVDGHLAEIN